LYPTTSIESAGAVQFKTDDDDFPFPARAVGGLRTLVVTATSLVASDKLPASSFLLR
jgi:hypothetical protein